MDSVSHSFCLALVSRQRHNRLRSVLWNPPIVTRLCERRYLTRYILILFTEIFTTGRGFVSNDFIAKCCFVVWEELGLGLTDHQKVAEDIFHKNDLENGLNLRHTLDELYMTSSLYVQYFPLSLLNHDNEIVWCVNKYDLWAIMNQITNTPSPSHKFGWVSWTHKPPYITEKIHRVMERTNYILKILSTEYT